MHILDIFFVQPCDFCGIDPARITVQKHLNSKWKKSKFPFLLYPAIVRRFNWSEPSDLRLL